MRWAQASGARCLELVMINIEFQGSLWLTDLQMWMWLAKCTSL
jgi:hypothetical protein